LIKFVPRDIFLSPRRSTYIEAEVSRDVGVLRGGAVAAFWKLFSLVPTQAIIEEADIRWNEVQKAVHEFEKDILKTISKKKGSILATQKVMKYIEDMNRRRVSCPCLKNRVSPQETVRGGQISLSSRTA
jgi:DNA-directed RNA polymerase alpha subunit